MGHASIQGGRMSLKPCRECKAEVSTEASSCPKCGAKNPTQKKAGWFVKIGGGFVVFVLVWFAFAFATRKGGAVITNDIYGQVAEDAATQYGIVSRNGSALEKCHQAGMVAAAYLQAKNEPYYKGWKEREALDCKAAEMPQ